MVSLCVMWYSVVSLWYCVVSLYMLPGFMWYNMEGLYVLTHLPGHVLLYWVTLLLDNGVADLPRDVHALLYIAVDGDSYCVAASHWLGHAHRNCHGPHSGHAALFLGGNTHFLWNIPVDGATNLAGRGHAHRPRHGHADGPGNLTGLLMRDLDTFPLCGG